MAYTPLAATFLECTLMFSCLPSMLAADFQGLQWPRPPFAKSGEGGGSPTDRGLVGQNSIE
eukprot:747749-Hanusia_phi.AAC.1